MSESPQPPPPDAPARISRRGVIGGAAAFLAGVGTGMGVGAEVISRQYEDMPGPTAEVTTTRIDSLGEAQERLVAQGLEGMSRVFDAQARFGHKWGVRTPVAQGVQEALMQVAVGSIPNPESKEGKMIEAMRGEWGQQALTPDAAVERLNAIPWVFGPEITPERQKVVLEYARSVVRALPLYAAALPPKLFLGADISSLCGVGAGGCAAVDFIQSGHGQTDQEFGRVFPHEMMHRLVNGLVEAQYGHDPQHVDEPEPGAFVRYVDQRAFVGYVERTGDVIDNFYEAFTDIPPQQLDESGVFGGYEWDGSRKALMEQGVIESLAQALDIVLDPVSEQAPAKSDVHLRNYLKVLHKAMRVRLGKEQRDIDALPDEVQTQIMTLIQAEVGHIYHNLHDANMPRDTFPSTLAHRLLDARDAHWEAFVAMASGGRQNPLSRIDQMVEGFEHAGYAREVVQTNLGEYGCTKVNSISSVFEREGVRTGEFTLFEAPQAPAHPGDNMYILAFDLGAGTIHYGVQSPNALRLKHIDNAGEDYLRIQLVDDLGKITPLTVNRRDAISRDPRRIMSEPPHHKGAYNVVESDADGVSATRMIALDNSAVFGDDARLKPATQQAGLRRGMGRTMESKRDMPVMYARNTYDGVLSYDIPQALDTDVVELPIDRSLNFITQAGERVMLMPRLDGKGFQTVFGARALESVWRLGDEGHALGDYLTRAGLDFQTEHDAAPEDVAALALLLKTEGFPFSQTIYVKGPNTLLPEVITEISLPRTYDPASKSIIGGQSAHLVVKA